MSLQYVNPRSLTFFHLRNLSKIRKYLTMEISEIAVHAFVTSKLNLTTVIIYSLVVQNISVTKSAIGSLSKDDGYGNKNVSPKYNLALSQLFRDYSVLFTLGIQANYPAVTGWVRTVLKSKLKMTFSLLYAHVVVKT